MKWAAEIDRILDEDTLYLRCQRIVPIEADSGIKDHYEILLGVRSEEHTSELQSHWYISYAVFCLKKKKKTKKKNIKK